MMVLVVQLLSHMQLFATPWTASHQAPLSSSISCSLLKFMSFESVMLSNHLIFSHPFSFCLQSFPASESFPMSQLFTSGSQSTGASAPVVPMSVQGWFPLGLLVWSSYSLRGSQESSVALQFESINSLVLSFLYGPTLTSVYDYWKNHSFDYTDDDHKRSQSDPMVGGPAPGNPHPIPPIARILLPLISLSNYPCP